jgi:glycyl-tRNA synthetase
MTTLGEQVAGMEQMDKLVTLCKRRGFVFANSEIYSGLAGFWDYGPLGCELKRNIEAFWWDFMVRWRDDVAGLDSACIGPEAVWKASGHVDAFNDALVDDKNSKERFRIDQLLYVNEADAEAAEVYALDWLSHGAAGDEAAFWDGLRDKLGYYPKNPTIGKDSRFTVPRQFNLMFKQQIGATGEAGQVGYLRAETCQPIFVDFDNIRNAARQKVPFGIAQIGKAFRNEINPRNFLFRAREFTQMELEFFVRPDELAQALNSSGADGSVRDSRVADTAVRPTAEASTEACPTGLNSSRCRRANLVALNSLVMRRRPSPSSFSSYSVSVPSLQPLLQ